jgi:hypothetical protein
MTTNHHTPITSGAAANASTFNAPLSELDTEVTAQAARVSDLEAESIEYSGIAAEFMNGQGDFAVPAGTGSTNGHVIQEDGVDKTQRAKLNFTGTGVAVVDGASATEVQINTGGHTIQDEGVNVTDRAILNFAGAGVTVTDSGGAKTLVTIPGGITDHGALAGLADDDHPQYLKVADYVPTQTPNILINGGFDFYQRQVPTTSTNNASGTYQADRWKMQFDTYSIYTRRYDGLAESALTCANYGAYTHQAGGGKKFILYQTVESINSVPLRGKTVIFQIKAKVSVAKSLRIGILELQNSGAIDTIPSTLVTAWNAAGTDPTFGANVAKVNAVTASVTTSWQTFSVSVTIPATSKNVICAVWAYNDPGANVAWSFAEAGLYLGSSVVSWRPGPIQDELMRCLRYYEKTYDNDDAPGTATADGAIIAYVAATGNKSVVPMCQYFAPKRTTPTVVCYTIEGTANNIGEYNAAGTLVSNRAQGIVASQKNIFYYTATNCTAGNTMRFQFTIDCEL